MKDVTSRVPMPRIFRALSDETRLRILHLLREGELCVGDLVKILRLPQAKTSRHLAYLRNARLVSVRANGKWSFYALARATDSVSSRLDELLQVGLKTVPGTAADARRAAKIRKEGGCCPK